MSCLPWDDATAMAWAELLARLRKNGRSMAIRDSMIAATAIRHNLTIATRNVSDFKSSKLPLVNPFH